MSTTLLRRTIHLDRMEDIALYLGRSVGKYVMFLSHRDMRGSHVQGWSEWFALSKTIEPTFPEPVSTAFDARASLKRAYKKDEVSLEDHIVSHDVIYEMKRS